LVFIDRCERKTSTVLRSRVMASQLGLFGGHVPAIDEAFAGLCRTELPPDAWFDLVPGWLSGHAELFRVLAEGTRWRQESREMYERTVEVPRLYAVLPADGPNLPLLQHMRQVLSRRYGEEFTRTSLAYYRDGNDSVAWHGDYVARRMKHALVATVSVGAPRRFLLRQKQGGSSLRLSLGEGDLLVMGGSCQRTWQHSVPKVARAAPRVSIMFRPTWEEEDGY
jgi:alkylated DNA repair dioxygenase AlkB